MPNRIRHFLMLGSLLCAPACALAAAAEPGQRDLDAVTIFTSDFGEALDVNYDDWPDHWTRESGPLYPHYVQMSIVNDDDLQAMNLGRALEIRLDGARAKLGSPPIRVLPKFSYTLSLKIKTENIQHSSVTVELCFLTPDGETIETHSSQPIQATEGWQLVELGKFRPPTQSVDRVVARIKVDRGDRGDLNGVVRIADVWLGRWPSMEVTTNSLFNVYQDPDNVVVTCALSGISEANPKIQFQLLDATQQELRSSGAWGEKDLHGKVIREETKFAKELLAGDGKHAVGYEGATTWSPNIRENGRYGFFRVRVRMISETTGNEMDSRVITLAVVPEGLQGGTGEFGWSLPESVPRLGLPLDFATLQELLPLSGVSWVKLPVWFPKEKQERGDAIIQFVERLAARDIETVGIIQAPEQELEVSKDEHIQPGETSEIEYTFRRDASVWLPLFDHVMNRLSLRLRWWQLGYDHDTSFVGHDDLITKIHDIRKQLFRFGQDARLGLGWRWDAFPLEGEVSWDFEQLSAKPPLQADELDLALDQRPADGAPRWVLIEPQIDPHDPHYPTPRDRHQARVREFIKQIVFAKRRGADAIYIPNPFSGHSDPSQGRTGVMNEDGTPGELLLPWRTAATLLGGAKYIGSLRLPNGSENWLFLRPDQPASQQVVMVVWNEKDTNEVLYLGNKIVRYDVWGEDHHPQQQEHRQIIEVGPEPAFVVGLNLSVARCRMSVGFQQESLPSVFSVEHPNVLTLSNEFPFGVGGTVSFFVPEMAEQGIDWNKRSQYWSITSDDAEIRGPAGSVLRRPIRIELANADFGPQPLRIDFVLNEDIRFSVWRTLNVGLGDLDIQVNSRIEDGQLIVQQRLVSNSGPPADFKCLLQTGQRRRKRAQVFQLGPEPDIKSFIYTNGEQLVGQKMTLRVEEEDGDRMMIYRFIATREADEIFEQAEESGRVLE